VAREGDAIRLRLDPRRDGLRTAATEERLAQALSRHLGSSIRLVIERAEGASAAAEATPDTPARREARAAEAELAAARAALEVDPTVRALKERFGASVQAETVKPVR
jgi:DNA polymerase-3 subunit gamma/tau